MKITKNHPLKGLNTFGLDIVARTFSEVSSVEELQGLLKDPAVIKDSKFILGGGSNILFTKNLDAYCIHNKIQGIQIVKEDEDSVWIQSGGGVVWHDLVMYCVERNYGGVENLSLIPGSADAAPIQNIGAYGVELKETF